VPGVLRLSPPLLLSCPVMVSSIFPLSPPLLPSCPSWCPPFFCCHYRSCRPARHGVLHFSGVTTAPAVLSVMAPSLSCGRPLPSRAVPRPIWPSSGTCGPPLGPAGGHLPAIGAGHGVFGVFLWGDFVPPLLQGSASPLHGHATHFVRTRCQAQGSGAAAGSFPGRAAAVSPELLPSHGNVIQAQGYSRRNRCRRRGAGARWGASRTAAAGGGGPAAFPFPRAADARMPAAPSGPGTVRGTHRRTGCLAGGRHGGTGTPARGLPPGTGARIGHPWVPGRAPARRAWQPHGPRTGKHQLC